MDPEARFRAVFDSAYAPLCRYARHRGLTGPDAEDLVAQTLEIAWRRIDDLPVAEPLPWLYAVAHNLWRNKARTDRRRRDLLARFRPPPPSAACGDPAALDPDDDAVGGRRYLPASWEECYQDREFGAARGPGRKLDSSGTWEWEPYRSCPSPLSGSKILLPYWDARSL